ncbi:MAG: NAD-dependent epimerase [Frankiales bacterium]|nr:NAD-dependent epimerase [Frankiales bacterium]
MRILVMGGSVFVSRAMAEVAVARGHSVTTFNRGLTGEPVPGVHQLTGDRNDPDALRQVTEVGDFDLVFDTGYTPAELRASTAALEPHAAHYAFVSSINVFPGWPVQADYRAGGLHAGDADAGDELPDDLDEAAAYGWRKAGAEQVVLRSFGPARSTLLRAGLIVGPHDGIGRLPWWLSRIARGGTVLAPGAPDAELRLIDARDIAEFALTVAGGAYEVTGPAHQITRAQLFDECRRVTGSDAEFRWVDDAWLARQDVAYWTEIPLWIPADEAAGIIAHDTRAAEAVGLACRPVFDTLIDTWQWMRAIEGGWRPSPRTPGLSADREAALIAAAP